jgi:flagellar operon protein
MADILRINESVIGPQPAGIPSKSEPIRRAPGAPSFADVLKHAAQRQSSPLKFSAHAQTRIQSRGIDLGDSEMLRIEGAVQKAAGKGARESLVLLDDTAFVVSVQNRTVITVVDGENLKQNVFTNIDSAVIA